MDILAAILADLQEDVPVQEVRIGPFWTAVISKHCGLASTTLGFTRDLPPGPPVKEPGTLKSKTALELCQYIYSESLLERSVGLAALNSLLRPETEQLVEVNGGELLARLGVGKKVCVVGHFPFIPSLREQVGQLWVLELNPRPGDLPAEEAARVLPEADIVAITSTALINGTMGDLLKLRREDAVTMVLGPSTPLSPRWFEHKVDLVSGTLVRDPDLVLRLISEGATFRQFRGRGIKTVILVSPRLKS